MDLTQREIVLFGFALGALTLYAVTKVMFLVKRFAPRMQASVRQMIEPWKQQFEVSRQMLDSQHYYGREVLALMQGILAESKESRQLLMEIRSILAKQSESLAASFEVATSTLTNVSDSNRNELVRYCEKISDKLDSGDKKVHDLGSDIGAALAQQVGALNETMRRFEALLFSREFGDPSAMSPMNENEPERASFIKKRMSQGVPQAFAESEWEQQLAAYRQTLRGDGLSSYNGGEEEIDLV